MNHSHNDFHKNFISLMIFKSVKCPVSTSKSVKCQVCKITEMTNLAKYDVFIMTLKCLKC